MKYLTVIFNQDILKRNEEKINYQVLKLLKLIKGRSRECIGLDDGSEVSRKATRMRMDTNECFQRSSILMVFLSTYLLIRLDMMTLFLSFTKRRINECDKGIEL